MKIYEVGGSVRDKLLGIEVNDIDYVVVGSSVEEMLALGYEQVGKGFPVFLKDKCEYALARKERKVKDKNICSHHSFELETEDVSLEEDLKRRDFTINAIVKLNDNTYFDPCGGISDLVNRRLRHINDAFTEDPLRAVRLFRFYAKLDNFTIDEDTLEKAKEIIDSEDFKSLPVERFRAELLKSIKYRSYHKFILSCIVNILKINKSSFNLNYYGYIPVEGNDHVKFAHLMLFMRYNTDDMAKTVKFFGVPTKWVEFTEMSFSLKNLDYESPMEILNFLLKYRIYQNPSILDELDIVVRTIEVHVVIDCYNVTKDIKAIDIDKDIKGKDIQEKINELRELAISRLVELKWML